MFSYWNVYNAYTNQILNKYLMMICSLWFETLARFQKKGSKIQTAIFEQIIDFLLIRVSYNNIWYIWDLYFAGKIVICFYKEPKAV